MESGYTLETVKTCDFSAILGGRVIREVGLYASTYGTSTPQDLVQSKLPHLVAREREKEREKQKKNNNKNHKNVGHRKNSSNNKGKKPVTTATLYTCNHTLDTKKINWNFKQENCIMWQTERHSISLFRLQTLFPPLHHAPITPVHPPH